MAAINGKKVHEWKELKDLLIKYGLQIPKDVKIVIIRCGLEEDHITINGNTKTIPSGNSKDLAIWHSKEYKTLCKKLGAINIETVTEEVLTIEEDAVVTMSVNYIV